MRDFIKCNIHVFKWLTGFLVFCTVLVTSFTYAATVTHLSTQTATATGSGSSGIPSIASFNIPSGKNRVLFIWATFERDHCSPADGTGGLCTSANTAGTGLGDNWPEPRVGTPPATTTNNQITARITGSGGTIDKRNALVVGGTPSGDTRFITISTSPTGSPAGTAFFSLSSFHIVLFENEINTLLGGAASGTVTISLTDVTIPSNAGDDAMLSASVFQNVEQTVTGFVRNATATAQVTTGTAGNFSLAPAAYDAGQGPDEADDGKLVMGASSTTQGFNLPAGHTALATISTTNNNGTYDTPNGNVNNEPNGVSGGAYFRTGGATPGSLYTLTSAATATPLVYGGTNASFLLESDNADVGDAPVSYGNPSHTIAGIRLGASVDADPSLLNNATGTGDDTNNTDDEDGVTLVPLLPIGQTTIVPVSIQNASGFLNAWFDWNADGDFNDSGEQMVTNQAVAVGTTNLSVVVPSGAVVGPTFARFRVCTNNTVTDNCSVATNTVQSGEVEDYQFQVGRTLTLRKTTLAAVGGPFGFTLTNTVQTTGSVTTTAVATPTQVDGDTGTAGTQVFTIASPTTAVTINENSLPTGWTLNGATCVNASGTTVGSLTGSTYTITGAEIAASISFTCTFTNHATDYGDAPDTGAGTATGNYRTTLSDGGPGHRLVTGLRLGSNIDEDSGALQNTAASADDTTGTPDDEDAVSSFPALGTIPGQVYTVSVAVTNTTGSNAYLVGYIDFNRDGDFLDSGEQSATVTVTASGSFNVSLTTPSGMSLGTTYARFRLSSTQSEVESSIGSASSGEVEDYSLTITDSADLSITKSGPGSIFQGQTITYTLQVTNAGPANVTSAVISDIIPANIRVPAWTCSVTTGTADCDTGVPGTSHLGTGNVSLSNVQMNAGAVLTITITGIVGTTASISNTATVRPPAGVVDSGYDASGAIFSGNNTSTLVTTVNEISTLPPSLPGLSAAGICAIPGVNGDVNLTGTVVVNTYFPPSAVSMVANAGATSISLGASRGANTAIAAGDLILFVQMQDAAMNTSNTSNYGGNNGTGAGYTSLGNTGLYEYVVATNGVATTGGTLNFRGFSGGGLVNTYTNAAASSSQGQRTFQVIRIPQYANLTISGTIEASKWNGQTGGMVVLDVAGTLTWAGSIDVRNAGFRAGYAPSAASGNSSGTLYRCTAKIDCGAGKGEGIAGTPLNLWDGSAAVSVGSGYPDGSTTNADFGMGAPGNAGGGGGFHNAGGGGGSNGGAGGRGGLGWEGQSLTNDGGLGGVALVPAINRLYMGGGGGGGDANNATSGVRGGVGAGIVMVRAGRMAGTGTVQADGDVGDVGVFANAPDGAGGGGAGGSVLLYAKTTSSASIVVNARGGRGGNTEQDAANEHGPGGGGGGGIVVHSVPGSTITANVAGGEAGRADSGTGTAHAAQKGADGYSLTFTASNDPFANGGDGSTCAPQLTTTKSTSTATRTLSDTMATYTITVSNASSRGTARGIAITDDLPSPFTYAATAVTPVYSGGASGPSSITGSGTDPVTFGTAGGTTSNSFTIPAGGSVQLTFNVNLNSAAAATYQNPAAVNYIDPTSATATISPGGTDSLGQSVTGSNYNSASSTAEDVTIAGIVLGIAKALDRIIHSANPTDHLYTLVYRLTLENFGSATLSNLVINDDIVTQFSGLNPANFNNWVNVPANAALLSPVPTLTLNGSWDGTSGSNMLSASQTLNAGQTKLVYVSFDVTVNPAASAPNNRLRDNTATARGTLPSTAVVSDTSTNGTDPDGTDNDGIPDENEVTPASFVKLIKEVRNCGPTLSSCSGGYVTTETGEPGDYLEYRIRFYNISSQAITTFEVSDTLVAATPFQEDTYGITDDFSLTCPNTSTVDVDRSDAAVSTTPASGAITAFEIDVMHATACNLATVVPGAEGYLLFKVVIP